MSEVPHRSVVVRCDCSCGYVGFDYWPEDDEKWQLYGEFYVAASTPGMGLRERLKALWTIARGREHILQAIVLDRPGAERLRDFLAETTRACAR